MSADRREGANHGGDDAAGAGVQDALVGRVTPEERDEIRALFERKNGLTELARALGGMNRQELDDSALYDRLVRDMATVVSRLQEWWNAKSTRYGWESRPGHSWRIDFETCGIHVCRDGDTVANP